MIFTAGSGSLPMPVIFSFATTRQVNHQASVTTAIPLGPQSDSEYGPMSKRAFVDGWLDGLRDLQPKLLQETCATIIMGSVNLSSDPYEVGCYDAGMPGKLAYSIGRRISEEYIAVFKKPRQRQRTEV